MKVSRLFIFRVGFLEIGPGPLVTIHWTVMNPYRSLMGGFQMIICSRISTILKIQLGKMLHSYKKTAAHQGALYDSKKRDEVRKRLRRILLSKITYGA